VTDDAPTPVAVEAVHARVHAGMSVARSPSPSPYGPDAPQAENDVDDVTGTPPAAVQPVTYRAPSAADVAHALSHEAIPVAAGTAVLIAARDPLLAVAGGGAVFAVLTLRGLAARVQFGFGDAFVGFRPDNGWPRGVQEDDDFHWSWSAPAEARPDLDRSSTAR
jgi:hypothetical protein